jgi:DNA adenine methylase
MHKILSSPLRYPGGKGSFYPFFVELLKHNELKNIQYYEPFAGGAGVALALLSSDLATEVILNDADYHIYSFWSAILYDNSRFIEKLYSIELSIQEWHFQKAIYNAPKSYSLFDVGFSTFYLNRCNRSGILAGAGPIGGYEQKGNWKLDARFNKESLIKKIVNIGMYKEQIKVKCLDAIDFLEQFLPKKKSIPDSLVYFDPPYVNAGNKLYLNAYNPNDHQLLARYILQKIKINWIVTYDDVKLIRELYKSCPKWLLSIGYSLQTKQKGKEILILPEWLSFPESSELNNNKWNISSILQIKGRS